MTNGCTIENRADLIATIIDGIPRSDAESVSLLSLCPFATSQDPSCSSCVIALLTFLQTFGVVTTTSDTNAQGMGIKAKSQTAKYFLNSFAAYLRKHLELVSDWEREGVGNDLSLADVLSSGAQFVYLMEQKRVIEHKDLSPIRQLFVSQAVIKARIRGKREPVYLVQFDAKARRFQLIGGRKRPADPDSLTVMQREIAEELPDNHLRFNKDYELRELVSDLQSRELSPTFGAYTEYHFTLYQASIKRTQLRLGPHDRWVTRAELLSQTSKDKVRISTHKENYLVELDKRLQGGLDGLQLSLDKVQSRALSEIIKERKEELELIGAILTIISIIVSIVIYLLSGHP